MPRGIYVHKKGYKRPPFSDEWRRHISKSLIGKSLGETNIMWKGDKVKYRALHAWLQRRLGSPPFCEHCKRTKPPKGKGLTRSYFQWANISGSYRRDVEDWKRLCYKCHSAFDKK